MIRILVTGEFGHRLREALGEAMAGLATVQWWDPVDGTSVETAAHAEIVVACAEWALDAELARRGLAALAQCRLVLVPFAGVEWLDRSLLPAGCVVCNTNAGAGPIAEYVLLGMLEMTIRLGKMDAELREGRWTWGGSAVQGRKHAELAGRTIGFVGFGRIAGCVSHLASAFGMTGIAVSRSPGVSERLAWWRDMQALDELLQQSDFVLLTVPGGAATRDLIGSPQLATMKKSSVLINVARASVINEKALFEALQNESIGGAVIDTWYQYPAAGTRLGAPSAFPFHTLHNVLMSPHAAGWTFELDERRVRSITANLRRYCRGDPLDDVV